MSVPQIWPAPAPLSSAQQTTLRKQKAAIWGLILFTAVAMVAGLGPVLQFAFLPLSVACGAYLLWKSPEKYVAFVFWLWALSPFVRRVADYQAGFQQKSLILLAPLVVVLISIVPILSKPLQFFRKDSILFVLVLLSVIYGAIIGCLKLPLATAVQVAIRWGAPVVFGLYCWVTEDSEHKIFLAIRNSIVAVGVVAGLYGISQFFHPPAWDSYWLENTNVDILQRSFGTAESMKIRVFSIMHSPGTVAFYLSCAFILLQRQHRPLPIRIVFSAIMALCLLLTQGRVAWAATLIGSLYILFKSGPRAKMIAAVMLVAFGLSLPILLNSGETGQIISDRLQTFSDLKHDESAQSRQAGIRDTLSMVLQEPFGLGIGYLDSDLFARSIPATRDQFAPHDMGLIEVPVEMGLPGALLYCGALLIFLIRALQLLPYKDDVSVSLASICLATFIFSLTGNPLSYQPGTIFWAIAGLLMAQLRRVQQADVTPWNLRHINSDGVFSKQLNNSSIEVEPGR